MTQRPKTALVVDGGVNRGQLTVREREERVGGDPADGDAGADCVRAFGERQLASHPDDSLHAFGHERSMVPAAVRGSSPLGTEVEGRGSLAV